MEEREYFVEKILSKRISVNGEKEYLIKWEGYPLEQSTWEPEHLLAPIRELIEDFESRKNGNLKNKIEEDISSSLNSAKEYKSKLDESDIPRKVLNVKLIGDELCALVQFEENSYGLKSGDCYLPTTSIKEKFAILLVDFYETKIKFNK